MAIENTTLVCECWHHVHEDSAQTGWIHEVGHAHLAAIPAVMDIEVIDGLVICRMCVTAGH